jgi:hypothetical protein
MKFLFVLLFMFGCSKEIELDTADRKNFENSWWEINCPQSECPLCFKLNQDHIVETYDLDSKEHLYHGTWEYIGSNIYKWHVDGDSYKLYIEPKEVCYELSYSIFKFDACPCTADI